LQFHLSGFFLKRPRSSLPLFAPHSPNCWQNASLAFHKGCAQQMTQQPRSGPDASTCVNDQAHRVKRVPWRTLTSQTSYLLCASQNRCVIGVIKSNTMHKHTHTHTSMRTHTHTYTHTHTLTHTHTHKHTHTHTHTHTQTHTQAMPLAQASCPSLVRQEAVLGRLPNS